MTIDLPEQLIAEAEFLLRNATIDEASVRRAVSSAYYAIFHLLVSDAVLTGSTWTSMQNWLVHSTLSA